MSIRNRGDLLIAHTTIELPSGEAAASWFFTPGSPPIISGPVEACDPGSGPEFAYVEVDGIAGKRPYPGAPRDCSTALIRLIGYDAFVAAEQDALEVAERDERDPDDAYDRARDVLLEPAYSDMDDWRDDR